MYEYYLVLLFIVKEINTMMEPGSLGALVVSITTDLSSFNAGIKAAEEKVRNTTGKITQYTDKIGLTMAAAGTAIVGAYALMVKASTNYSDQIYEVSQRTGVAVETLSQLKYVADQTESSFEAVAMGMKFLNRNIYEATTGNKAMNDNFRQLGITLRDDVTGNVLKADEVFLKLADKFANLADGAAKTNMAMQIFGRSGDSLIPVLNLGSEGIKRLSEEAARLGIVLTKDNAVAIDKFSDGMKTLKAAMGGLALEITNILLPALISFAKWATEIVIKLREWIAEHPILTKIISAFGIALLTLGTGAIVVNQLTKAIQTLYITVAALKLLDIATVIGMGGLTTDIATLIGLTGILFPIVAAIGAAFAGWKIGRVVSEATGLDEALSGENGLFTKMMDRTVTIEEKARSLLRILTAIATLGMSEVTGLGSSIAKSPTSPQFEGATGSFTASPEAPAAESGKTQLEEIVTLVQRHAEALKTLNEEYLSGKLTAQEYYDGVAQLHRDGLDIKQQELDLLQQSISLEQFATEAEQQKIFVMNEGIQTAQAWYQARAEAANADEMANIKTMQSMTNLQKTITGMQPTWGQLFDFINMGIQKFSSGFSTALSSIILGTKTAKEAFADFGKMMVTAIVEFVVQWAVQTVIAIALGWLITAMMGRIADSMTAMWMGPAILASIASYGAAAMVGTAAVAGALGTGAMLAGGLKAAQPIPIASSAEGNIFTRPALTTIAEREPEGVFPLSKLPMGNTININIESPIISGILDIADLAEQLGDFIKQELRTA